MGETAADFLAHFPHVDNADRALALVPSSAARVVIMHHPVSFTQLPPDSAPLAIAAHTHGGQVRLPFLPNWSWRALATNGPADAGGWIDGYACRRQSALCEPWHRIQPGPGSDQLSTRADDRHAVERRRRRQTCRSLWRCRKTCNRETLLRMWISISPAPVKRAGRMPGRRGQPGGQLTWRRVAIGCDRRGSR